MYRLRSLCLAFSFALCSSRDALLFPPAPARRPLSPSSAPLPVSLPTFVHLPSHSLQYNNISRVRPPATKRTIWSFPTMFSDIPPPRHDKARNEISAQRKVLLCWRRLLPSVIGNCPHLSPPLPSTFTLISLVSDINVDGGRSGIIVGAKHTDTP